MSAPTWNVELARGARAPSKLDVGTPVGQELPTGGTLLQLTQIQLCIENRFLTDWRPGDHATERIGNIRLAGKGETLFLSHSIGQSSEIPVLKGGRLQISYSRQASSLLAGLA